MDRSHRVSAACGQIYLSFIRNHKSNYVCMKFRLLPLGKYILFVPSYSQNCLVRPLPGYEFYPLPDAQVHNNIFLFLVKHYTRIRCTSQKTVGVQNMAATKSSKDESRPKMIYRFLQLGGFRVPGCCCIAPLVFLHYSWFSVFLNELNWPGYRFIVVCIW